MGQTITKEQGEKYLQHDIKTAEKAVDRIIKVPLNENQKAALTDFTYNLGASRLEHSTLAKDLNAGKDPNTVASTELPKWDKAG